MFLLSMLLGMYGVVQGSAAVYVRAWVISEITGPSRSPQAQVQNLQRHIAMIESHEPQWSGQTEDERVQRVAMIQQQITFLQGLPPVQPSVSLSLPAAIWEAVAMPAGGASNGVITHYMGTEPYVPPRDLWEVVLRSRNPRVLALRPGLNRIDVALLWLAGWTGVLILMPLSLVLLPISRRRAKVRWSHIVRVSAYSLFIPIITILASAAFTAMWLFGGSIAGIQWMHRLAIYLPPLLLLCWWGAALARYLKIRHGHGTAVILCVLCSLLMLTTMWFVAQEMLLLEI
jgi:hypothetical protein